MKLTASKDSKHPNHVRHSNRPGGEPALRLSGIYGPNGHGKTRLIEAVQILERLAINDHDNILKKIEPFKLRKDLRGKPSHFVINYRMDDVDYEYGIIVDSSEIHQEWLFETEKRQETLLFSRVKSEKKLGAYNYEFGSKLKKSPSPTRGVAMADYLKVIATGTDAKTTFLSEAIEKKIKRLSKAHDWFAKKLLIVNSESTYGPLLERMLADETFMQSLNDNIVSSDTGISDLKVEKSQLNKAALATALPVEGRGILEEIDDLEEGQLISFETPDGTDMTMKKVGEDFEITRLRTLHSSDDGSVEFHLSEESSGTRRLFDLYPMFHIASDRDAVFLVDELDRKLHPLLSYEFIRRFSELAKGQLIFTTHTTHLLDLALLRRDEVWLLQKDQTGATELYSLDQFKIRPDLDIRKGYLQGRFGAVPFLGSAIDLGWCDDEN